MNEAMRRMILAEAKKSGKNKGAVVAVLNKADQETQRAARAAEAKAKSLRIQKECEHFDKLLNGIRVMPSFDVQLARSFPNPLTDQVKDDGYIAVIGVTAEHVVFGGDYSRWSHAKHKGIEAGGTWRDGGNIQNLTHISILGYRKGGIGSEEHLAEMLETARMINPMAAATVRMFDNNGKMQYDSLDELKADIKLVLSKIYKL